MKARAARLYGVRDIRVEEFEMPEITEKELLVRIVSNSICMSTHKAAILGEKHKRVPETISEKPVITGHEWAGEVIQVGDMWKDKYTIGDKVSIQPALYYGGTPHAPGYSYEYCGGNTTHCIIPWEFIEFGCVLKYDGEDYYNASLAEPMSCIIGSYHSNYRMEGYTYVPQMGIKEGGNLALLAAAGPMGLGAIDYALHCDRKPGRLVVVDINEERLETAKRVLPVEEAAANGVELHYVNSSELDDPYQYMMDLTDGNGYDDTYVYVPVRSVVALADDILGKDGCLNFFAGPTDTQFKGEINLYKVHYSGTHVIGSTGGSTADMQESLDMTAEGKINPAFMITHVGGLDVVPETVLNLPNITGGKKLIYTHVDMPLIDIRDFSDLAAKDDRYKELEVILDKTDRIWSLEAEKYVLNNFSR